MPDAHLDDLLLSSLLSASPSGIAVLDRDLRYLRINAQAAAFNGLPPEAHIGRRVQEIASAETWAAIEPVLAAVVERGERFVDIEVPGAVGPGQMMRSSAWPLRDEHGEIVGAVITREDITASKLIADALGESEERYRALVELSPFGVLIVEDSHLTFANGAAARIFGAERPADLIGRSNMEFIPPDQRALAKERLRLAHETKQPAPLIEMAYLRLDGTAVDVETHGTAITVAGRPATMVVFRDITARRRAERELRLQGAALQAAANGILITDRAGVIEWTNPAFTAITGFSIDEARGRRIGDLVTSEHHDAVFFREMWQTILGGGVWHGELVNRRKDGSLYTEDMTITPLTSATGEITHFIAVTLDVTQRKLLEEQYRQAQKMDSIGRLAGGVAHDFNNQLGVIIGQVEMELRGLDPASALHGGLREIHDAATRSAALTRQLLTFARKQDIAPRVMDLTERVAQSLKMLQRMIGEHIQMSWEPSPDAWPVLMDPTQVDQILANLCVNARDAIANVGRIALATANCTLDAAFCARHADAAPGDYVRLTVRDTGSGMSAEVIARVFEPFFTTKKVGEGTGLGLATVYGAVRQNHGFITVESARGKGTTFSVYLPRAEGAAATAEAPAVTAEPPRGTETILLVEDEPAILRMATRALESLDYTVLAASGAEEAMRVARQYPGRIHLLLTDVVMPEMNGADLVVRLSAARPDMKHLFMSGFTGDALSGARAAAAAGRMIEKPFAVRELAEKVREVLGEA